MASIGYARVSTDGQDYTAQVAALKAAGCEKIVSEKISGASLERRALVRLIEGLSSGDQLVVTRLDRLARSTRDLLNVLADVGAKGATFRSLADSWADTSTPQGQLMITILGGLAQYERTLILSRTREGRMRARANGVKMGRPNALTPYQQQEASERKARGESLTSIARSFNVSHSTISRLDKWPVSTAMAA